VYYFQARLEHTGEESCAELNSSSRYLALPVNIRLVFKRMAVTNTLAYYDTATITAEKSFIVQALLKFL
jgi:hypothetical protein